MSFWSTLKRWLGFARDNEVEIEEVITLTSTVAKDVGQVVAGGVSPAGVIAAVKTAEDVVQGVAVIQVQGGIRPMPLTAKDVALQQAQIKSATRPVPPPAPSQQKPPPRN